MQPETYLELLLPSFVSVWDLVLDSQTAKMKTERVIITPEPAEGSQAPLTPPSEPQSVTASSRSPRVFQRKEPTRAEQTPLQAISHGILMDGKP